jgi:LAS superfamily LD-carboxypeptidase LdcB
MLNDLELTGRARTHVVQRDDLGAAIAVEALEPFLAMKAAAARDGIDIAIVSGFRDFWAQQRIWDMKFRGERPLYDEHGHVRDRGAMSDEEAIEAILCWSAMPGASRHHWGSEVDLIDAAAMPEGYRVQLAPAEAAPGGVFHALHCWLDMNMSRYGFFRPYATFRGGVRPEAWHLSYGPMARHALNRLTPALLMETVGQSDMLGRDIVLRKLATIYDRYVANVDAPSPDGPAMA